MLVFAVSAYLLLNLLIGFLAARFVKNPQDFAFAGRRLPLGVATTALFATWFGSETILGASGEFVEKGVLGIIEEPLGAGLCLILVGLFFAKKLYRLNVLTINDYLGQCYGKKVEYSSAVLMIVSFFGWIAAQLLAMGFILQTLLQIPFYWAISIGTLVVLCYTYVGGMWAISITDFLQTIFIIVGLVFLVLQLCDILDFGKIEASLPPDFFRFYPKNTFLGISEYIAAWATVGLGSLASQDVFQRVMTSKNEQTAALSAILAGILYLTMACLPLFIALAGKVLYPELMAESQNILLKMVLLHSQTSVQMLFFGSLLAAVMSTASSTVLAPATVLAENIIKPFLSENLQETPQILLKIMRVSVILTATAGLALGLSHQNIYELAGGASAFTLVSLLVPLVGALWFDARNEKAALVSMFLGLSVWLVMEFYETHFPSVLGGFLASLGGFLVPIFFEKKKKMRSVGTTQEKK